MFKIKLLILSLASLLLISCTNNKRDSNIRLSVSYIGGEYDGLQLYKKLKSHLNNFGILDDQSDYQIQASVSHSTNLFITNIDNTSDRERVTSNVQLKIYNTELSCFTYSFEDQLSQFYILAPGDKFVSNKSAVEEIKEDNIDYFVKKFISGLTISDLDCDEIK
jgi:hypothetical protein